MRRLLIVLLLLLSLSPAAAQDALLPPLQPLTRDNAARLTALARLGRGVVRDILWSPDGADLAVATTLGVWLQAASATAEARLVEGQLGSSAIAFHPDGQTLASGGDDGSVMLIDRASGTERQRAERHIYAVVTLGYSADGQWLASADASGVVRVWAAADLREQAVFQSSGVPWAIALNPDGSAVAVSTRAGVDVWRLDGGMEPVARWPLPAGTMSGHVPLVFSDVDTLTFAHGETLYRAQIGNANLQADERDAAILDLVADGASVVVITHADRRFEAHRIDSGERLAVLDDPDRSASVVRFSPDWSEAAGIGAQGPRVLLWTLGDRAGGKWLAGYTGPLTGLAHDSTTLAAVDDAGYVTLWNPTNGARVATFQTWTSGHAGAALAASPDGRLFATGGDDSLVRLYDAITGAEVQRLHGHIRSVAALAFNADGTLLASGSLDGAIHVWDVANGALLARLSGHSAGVTGLVFSARGGLLASSSHDGTVRLWGVRLEAQ